MSFYRRWVGQSAAVFCFSFLTVNAFAQDKIDKKKRASSREQSAEKKINHWAGSNVQLGMVINTGNTNSSNIAAGAKLKYTNSPWLNITELNAQFERSHGDTTKQRFYGSNQLQYSFSKERSNYVYANTNVTSDRFSPYEFQVISSAGYGRDWIKTDCFTWSAQAGPGMRFDDVRHSKENDKNFILYTQTNLDWKISKTVQLTEQLQYTLGHPYNYLNSVTAMTNKLTGSLSMQVSYTIQYYSKIPMNSTNTKKLDTVTNIALVYSF